MTCVIWGMGLSTLDQLGDPFMVDHFAKSALRLFRSCLVSHLDRALWIFALWMSGYWSAGTLVFEGTPNCHSRPVVAAEGSQLLYRKSATVSWPVPVALLSCCGWRGSLTQGKRAVLREVLYTIMDPLLQLVVYYCCHYPTFQWLITQRISRTIFLPLRLTILLQQPLPFSLIFCLTSVHHVITLHVLWSPSNNRGALCWSTETHVLIKGDLWRFWGRPKQVPGRGKGANTTLPLSLTSRPQQLRLNRYKIYPAEDAKHLTLTEVRCSPREFSHLLSLNHYRTRFAIVSPTEDVDLHGNSHTLGGAKGSCISKGCLGHFHGAWRYRIRIKELLYL